MVYGVEVEAETSMKEWSKNGSEGAATRPVKAAAKDDPTTSILRTERNPVSMGARVTTPIEPSDY